MKRPVVLAALLCCVAVSQAKADPPFKPMVTGLRFPGSIAIGPDGRTYVTGFTASDRLNEGGAIMVIDKGKAVPFVTGLDRPDCGGIAVYQKWLFVGDRNRIWKIDMKGNKQIFVEANAFPVEPSFGNMVVDPESGTLYVTHSGHIKREEIKNPNAKTEGDGLFRISPKGKVDVLIDPARPTTIRPLGLAMDGASSLLIFSEGKITRLKLGDKSMEEIANGDFRKAKLAGGSPVGGGRLVWDQHGRLYVSVGVDFGKIFVFPRPGEQPILLAEGFRTLCGICLDASGKNLLVCDVNGGDAVQDVGTLTAVPLQKIPGWEVDDSPLPLETAVAFPDLKWTGWSGETPSGKVVAHRPIVLTHAGDGSHRAFVATQQGVIHVFPNDPDAKEKADKTKIFLDIQKKVSYKDNENEEGLLGLAFHPQFKKNGEFFVFYTPRNQKPPHTNIVSRFRVSKDDPDKADPDFEEELLRIEHKYWNHDGGTICFGPDGFLYIAIGDGGAGNDPDNNGQNLKTLLAKVLRIDVDRKDEGKKYSIPKDNPFVDRADARPEVWAYGLRNVWRMSFDRKTGKLWASDVGQNLFEEIDHIVKGGNFGWSVREGLHPFGKNGSGPKADLIEPIWEYDHTVGKSLTGGNVYRGKKLPELDGAYLYGDYITGKIWALRYDETKKRVVENRPIPDQKQQIMSFGEDEQGEVYFMTFSNSGRGIFQFVRKK